MSPDSDSITCDAPDCSAMIVKGSPDIRAWRKAGMTFGPGDHENVCVHFCADHDYLAAEYERFFRRIRVFCSPPDRWTSNC